MLRQLQFTMREMRGIAALVDKNSVNFRKPVIVLVCGCGMVMIIGFTISFVVDKLKGLPLGAAVMAAFAYALWLLGWNSAVRIRGDGVIVDNILMRHVIPWSELSEITVRSGLEFRLRDGRSVGSLMYGGSVLGALLGYKYTRNVAAKMREAQKRVFREPTVSPQSSVYRPYLHFSPWPPLVFLSLMEAIASFSFIK